MTLARKHLCLAVLMALLIGHFGMAVHVTTHAIGEASECELCLSYNDSSEALTALPERGVAPMKESSTVAAARDPVEKRGWAPFLQRDPPGSI
jgi:hypothetical protein